MRDFGIMLGCAEMGVPPKDFPFVEGAVSELNEPEAQNVGRILVKAARDVMVATGRGREAPALHFHFVAKSADWNSHCQEVADHVAGILKFLDPMMKKAAFPGDLMSVGGLGAQGALYGALGGGAGLGALYWLLSRHATQDEADAESMQHQVDYYNNLSRELSDSMRRKYQYNKAKTNQPERSVYQ